MTPLELDALKKMATDPKFEDGPVKRIMLAFIEHVDQLTAKLDALHQCPHEQCQSCYMNRLEDQVASLRQGVETLRSALVDSYEFHQRTECIGGGVESDPCTCRKFESVRAALRETEGLVKP